MGFTRRFCFLLVSVWMCVLNGCGSGMLQRSAHQLVRTSIQITLSPNSITVGQPFSIKAAVIAAGATPTGMVRFSDNAVALGSRTLDNRGEALLTTSAVTSGSHSFVVDYDGSPDYSSAESAVAILLASESPITETTAIHIAVSPFLALVGQQVSITGILQGAVQVPRSAISIYDGDTFLGTSISDDNGVFTFVTIMQLSGTHHITARYYGDSTHTPCTSTPESLTIISSASTTSTSLSVSLNPATTSDTIIITAHITPSLSDLPGRIHFYEGTSELATRPISADGSATINHSFSAGTHFISAAYEGSGDLQPSHSLTLALHITSDNSGEQALQADSFVDSIGINTHLSYTDTPYFSRWPDVLLKLQRAGIRHIRDGFYSWSNEPFIAEHQALARAGIRCNYIIPFNLQTTSSAITSFAERVKDMEAVEGPNECDAGNNCGGGSTNGISAGVAFMETVHEAGSALHIPVIGPSFTTAESYRTAGNLSSVMNYNNLHVYFGGRNPGSQGWGDPDKQGHSYGSFEWWEDQAELDALGLPLMITEAGYISLPGPKPYTISEGLGASYVPRLLFLAFNKGFKRTYLYELLDEVSSPGYGLLRSDLSEKPAFTALTSLVTELADPGTAFTPATLNYRIEGGDSSLAHTLLQKRDGSFRLVLWSEKSNYDVVTANLLPSEKQRLTLTVPESNQTVEIDHLDELGNLSRSALSGHKNDLMVDGTITLVTIK